MIRLSLISLCQFGYQIGLFAFVLVPISGEAQGSATVRGQVIDELGVAVAHAEVELRPGSRRTIASQDGRFSFFEVPIGQLELSVRRLGYSPVQVRFSVSTTDTTLRVTMTAIPRVLDSVRVRERASGRRFNITVVDDSGVAVPEAEVIAAGMMRLTTNADGNATISSTRRGTVMIRIRKIGYKPFLGAFTLEAERADTVVVARLPRQMDRVMVLAESGFGRDTFIFAELDSRMKWKTSRAGVVSREELAPFGDQNLCSAIQQTRTAGLIGREFWAGCDRPLCILINGERPVKRPLSSFLASEVEAVEYFPAGSDWSGTIFSRAGLTCYPYVRGSLGPGKHPGGHVVWLRSR